jgi:N-acetylmuramoyl-L-alanine amidase
LSELDFPASVVEGNGLYRVMVGVFPTLHDAAETERRLRSAGYQTVIVSQ